MIIFSKKLLFIFSCSLALSEANLSDAIRRNMPEDGYLNFTQLVTKYGSKSEEFDVETDDGYILKIFHIIGNESKTPVFLMHGLEDSADSFVLRGKKSIAINLSEAGYDVWLGNIRGNKYSKRHVKLSTDENNKDFWDFSFHEAGVHDMPAAIDFILEKTGKQKLATIGHSQGTTTFYALGSMKPEYNKKISVHISLAPVAYLTHTGPGFSLIINFCNNLGLLGYHAIFPDNSVENKFWQFICSQEYVGYDLCAKGVVGYTSGYDLEEFEPEFLKILVGHYPTGASQKAFAHFAQIENSKRFAQYDHGVVKNILVYKSEHSPLYNLSQVTMPIVLVAAKNDPISSLLDIERLKSELPNVVKYHLMEREKFNHMDYIMGKHLDIYMTPLLRDLLGKYA